MRGIPYSKKKHFDECLVTWKDAGWHEKGREEAAAEFFEAGEALVGEQDGKAVALALSCPGTLHHQLFPEDLKFCIISGITTAFHGRKSGFAGTLTAELLGGAAERGVAVAGLGMFEQGFYDRLGFGNMPYWNSMHLRPSEINLTGDFPSSPVRLGPEDWEEIHRCRLERNRCHGSVNGHPVMTKIEMGKAFVLGFRNPSGVLTHHVHFHRIKGENGPAYTGWLAFRTPEQFRDLMLLLKSLGDQIDIVRISEIPGLSLQTILKRPMTSRRRSRGFPGPGVGIRSVSWTQCRILDVEKSINGMICPGRETRFNLTLTDPVTAFLDESFSWRGCSGQYTVTFSGESEAVKGHTDGLPELACSVNTFTRLWNGSSRATMLPYTDRISASADLLEALDQCLSLPEPCYDWEL